MGFMKKIAKKKCPEHHSQAEMERMRRTAEVLVMQNAMCINSYVNNLYYVSAFYILRKGFKFGYIRLKKFIEEVAHHREIIKCSEQDGIDYLTYPLIKEWLQEDLGYETKRYRERFKLPTQYKKAETAYYYMNNGIIKAVEKLEALFMWVLHTEYFNFTKEKLEDFHKAFVGMWQMPKSAIFKMMDEVETARHGSKHIDLSDSRAEIAKVFGKFGADGVIPLSLHRDRELYGEGC